MQITEPVMSWEEPQPPILNFGIGMAVTFATILLAGLLVYFIWG